MREIIIEDGICRNKEDLHFEAKEAKEKIPRDAWDTYSAFANTDGGTIVFGLREEDGVLKVVGVSDAQGKVQNIWNLLNNREFVSSNILSNNDLEILDSEGCELIVMTVPRANRFDRPVYISGNPRNAYKRNGEGDYKCTPEEITSMIVDSSKEPADRFVIKSSYVSDFCKESVEGYRNYFKMLRPESELNRYDDENFLRIIGAVAMDEGTLRPTFAGLLMFGTDPTISLEAYNYCLDYRRYADSNVDWEQRLVTGIGNWSGNVFDFYMKTCQMIKETIRHRMTVDGELVRRDDNEIDRVIREALLNALVNADYRMPGGVTIERKPGSLTIRNPGTFRIPLDMAEKGGFSDPRNPTMLKMLSLLGFGERAGSGIPRMNILCNEVGLPVPKFEENYRPDAVTVRIVIDDELTDLNDEIIIDMIRNNPKISITNIAEKRNVDRNLIARKIERMKVDGMIERVGGTRGYWKVR